MSGANLLEAFGGTTLTLLPIAMVFGPFMVFFRHFFAFSFLICWSASSGCVLPASAGQRLSVVSAEPFPARCVCLAIVACFICPRVAQSLDGRCTTADSICDGYPPVSLAGGTRLLGEILCRPVQFSREYPMG
eukprot:GHVT01047954.1.p1 GENE.GHVT01047954.1~~GHVT01047954.1.p1  ORF type:complete len:133 (-),score=4.43 GHVT01047954.1:440-838(-)